MRCFKFGRVPIKALDSISLQWNGIFRGQVSGRESMVLVVCCNVCCDVSRAVFKYEAEARTSSLVSGSNSPPYPPLHQYTSTYFLLIVTLYTYFQNTSLGTNKITIAIIQSLCCASIFATRVAHGNSYFRRPISFGYKR